MMFDYVYRSHLDGKESSKSKVFLMLELLPYTFTIL